MTDTGSDLEPGTMVPDEKEKVEGHNVRGGEDQQKQWEWGQLQASRQNSKHSTYQKEGNEKRKGN